MQEAFVVEDDDVVVLGEKAAGEGTAEKKMKAEVMAWLRSLGYQQYETVLLQAGFDSLRAAQHLDDEALLQLKRNNKNKCGAELVGHRRVLCAAAAALRADRAPGEEFEVRQLLLQPRLHQQQTHGGFPSPAPSPSASARPAQAGTPVSGLPRVPSSTASAKSATTVAGSSPRGSRASSLSAQSASGQGQRGSQTPPPGPSPTRPRPEADHNVGGSSAERMRGLFNDLLEPQRMYSPHKPISGGQFASVNGLLGCIVGPDRSPAAAAAAAAKPPPRPQQPEPRE